MILLQTRAENNSILRLNYSLIKEAWIMIIVERIRGFHYQTFSYKNKKLSCLIYCNSKQCLHLKRKISLQIPFSILSSHMDQCTSVLFLLYSEIFRKVTSEKINKFQDGGHDVIKHGGCSFNCVSKPNILITSKGYKYCQKNKD